MKQTEITPVEGKQAALQEALLSIDESGLSSLSRIISGILKIINEPSSTAKDLQDIIQVDPPLTIRLLRLVNSAYYAVRTRITEIEKAVIWVGFAALKELALSQTVCSLFKGDELIEGYSRAALWEHSVAVALLSKMVYRREFGERGENAYAAGLLHDLGIILEDQLYPGEFKHVLRRVKKEQLSMTSVEQEVFAYDHAEVGGLLAERWNFPRELTVAIGSHHNPLGAGESHKRLASTIFVADYACAERKIGCSVQTSFDKKTFDTCFANMGVKAFALDLIIDDMVEDFQQLRDRGLI